MKMNKKRLSELPMGEWARVSMLMSNRDLRRRLLDIGLSPGTRVRCVGKSPLGDPRAYFVRGVRIAIRQSDADKVIIE